MLCVTCAKGTLSIWSLCSVSGDFVAKLARYRSRIVAKAFLVLFFLKDHFCSALPKVFVYCLLATLALPLRYGYIFSFVQNGTLIPHQSDYSLVE